MMKTFFVFALLIFVFTSCNKEEDTPYFWDISGKVMMTDAQVPEIKTPLEGVKIYLLKGYFTLDTTTHWFVYSDILDSAKTDVNGTYSFNGLKPADYVVLPGDTTLNYRFSWAESPDSVWIDAANTQKQFEINFTTPEPVEENFLDYFKFRFYIQNYDSNNNISMFRTARENLGCGWLGASPCNWYWKLINRSGQIFFLKPVKSAHADVKYTGSKTVSFSDLKDASGMFTDYKDEFHFKFYIDNDWVYTLNISGGNLKDTNEYDVVWQSDGVEITQHY